MNKICIGLLGIVLAGCANKPAAHLQKLNWDAFNRTRIESVINEYGKNSAGYNAAKPPYAVFDWDNTTVFLDIEEATLVYMLKELKLKATPELLNEAIRKGIGSDDFKPEFNNLDGKSVNIDRIAGDIIESYSYLYKRYNGFQGAQTMDEIRKSPHYMAFASKLRYLYDAVDGTFGHDVCYPWITYLFAGMTEADVRQLARETFAWQLTQQIENVTWTTPEALPGRAGCVSVTWKNGLRAVPEMQNLYQTLRDNGFDVWVCSASFVDIIREVASNPEFGYNNPAERVIAMELERDADGRILPEFRHGYEQTQGVGKTANIKRFLVSKYGYGPTIVAGDSEGDQNMLEDFANTKISLIINRLRSPSTLIGQESKRAVDSYGQKDARYLLQGRDDNTGLFRPEQASVKFGSTEAKKL